MEPRLNGTAKKGDSYIFKIKRIKKNRVAGRPRWSYAGTIFGSLACQTVANFLE